MAISAVVKSAVGVLERADVLDRPAQALAAKIRGLLSNPSAKDAISGTPLGHPVHPPLTDLAIGTFFSASLLDLLLPRAGAPAARRLLTIGIAASLPTALTGFSDWADTELSDVRVRRVGLIHATANLVAVALYSSSLAARRRRSKAAGTLLALAGAGTLGSSGYLGGHLTYARGVGVDQTVFDPGPEEWTTACSVAELTEGRLHSVDVDGTPVLLVRQPERIYAIHDRCSHRGCSLSDGELGGRVITCPCHGSRFDIRDGGLLQGPATVGQPAFDVQETDGQVRIRRTTRH
ncbi:Rieske 2Fe-2S domain-containing protein [Mycobacterium sp. 1274756.6]|uniref:Rieske 2Fe-2S domain-containing protein n=1 Tax=Mycobacterium sp. 1274756.6 TaxID=1834076 RepID=UPI0018D48001|nr:Rieske 2Fe-2S domain-containing protein [Mycobacterium sp. 1274756.6]